ncbi:MAG: hypothetical protein B7Z73_08245 [Planctomycetia bacterium 21-64-5]|nr:MAG: hypothetical protein B7Z73_08245 [Planctomycetia bacterium 21-64-5]
MADFDPYHKWLGIPLKDQPPNHYRLLGIELFESDPDVIESAADQRMAHVRTFQTGQNSAVSQRILNELSAAKLCLLNPQKRAEYDRPLREKTQAADSAISPGGSRGEGGQPRPSIEPHPGPRPVPQAVPLQRARPMPQVEAMPLVQPTPVIVPGAGPSSGINIHKRVSRKAPLWQQPAVLVAAAAAVVMMAIGGYYVTPAKQTPATSVVTNPSKESRPSAPTATSPVASVDPAAPVDSLPPPPAKSSTGTTVAAPSVALPSAPSTPDFEIIEATWGVGDKWVNVTDAVRNRVKDHRLMMMVWANLFGSPEDPAPGTGKKLRIQYRARGRRYTVEYPDVFFAYLDGNPLAPPTDSPDGLELLEARYGAGASYVDVLAQLRDHLHDGRLSVPANQFVGTTADELAKHGLNSGTFKLLWVRYRNGTGEHYTYAWKADRLAIDSRLPEAAGPPVDLLKLIDVNRDVVEGNWTLADGILSGPATQNARIEIPFDPHEEYALTVVAEGDPEIKDISVLLPVDGRQVMSVLDGFSGIGSGLHMINGRVANDNPAYPWRRTRMLEQGRPNTLLYVVRRRSIRVFRDGAEIIRWSGDPQTFSIADIWALRSTRRIGLEAYDTPFRVRKLVLVPLTPEKSPMLTQLEPGKTVDLLKQIDRDRDLLYGNW